MAALSGVVLAEVGVRFLSVLFLIDPDYRPFRLCRKSEYLSQLRGQTGPRGDFCHPSRGKDLGPQVLWRRMLGAWQGSPLVSPPRNATG